MTHINPDRGWYIGVSERKGVRPRCPFASVHRCPRFYQSLSLLGSAGSTSIEKNEDAGLLEKWKKSDLWPTTSEQASAIFSADNRPHMFSNFCPEVAFERFGWFASDLARHADEIDANAAHARLSERGVPGVDWRWAWSSVEPMHYTECPIYSPLEHDAAHARQTAEAVKDAAPANLLQAVLRWLWGRPRVWRYTAFGLIIIVALAFAIWTSLPESKKNMLLDALSTIHKPSAPGTAK